MRHPCPRLCKLILMPTPHVAEQPAELYWKKELGSDTPIPRIVKDALINGPVPFRTSFVLTDPFKASVNIGKEIIYSFDQHRQATNQVKPLDSGNFVLTDPLKASVNIGKEIIYTSDQQRQATNQVKHLQSGSFHMTEEEKDEIREGKEILYSDRNQIEVPRSGSFVLTDPLKASINIGKEIIYSSDQRRATNQVKPLHSGSFHVTEEEKENIREGKEILYNDRIGVPRPGSFALTDPLTASINIGKEIIYSSDQRGQATNQVKPLQSGSFHVTEEQRDNIRQGKEILYNDRNQVELPRYKGGKSQEHTIDPTQHVTYVTEKDLIHPGKTLKMHFVNGKDDFKFIPSKLAKSIPFTSAKLPQLLKFFNVEPKSVEAEIIEDSLKACEKKIEGENKYCATSLEGMVDFVTTFIGHNVSILSSYSDHEINEELKIVGAKRVGNDANIACHKMGYPYAVFYCHNTKNTIMYDVSLVGKDGKKMSGVAVCHRDTSTWGSDHIAFQILHVKPGSPLCHFLDGRSMVWVPK